MEPDGRLRVDLEGDGQARSLAVQDQTELLLEGISNDLQGVDVEDCCLTFKVEVRRASSRHVCRLGNWGEGQELRWLAAARCKLWWMTPSWGDAVDAVPPETQFLLVRSGADGAEAYVLFFPLVTGRFRSSITSYQTKQKNSAIQLVVESADEGVVASSIDHVLLVIAGTNPFEVLHRGFRIASELPEAGFRLSTGKPRPKMLDRFGWCTWDAFMDKAWYQSRVTPEGIYEGLRQFAAGGIRVRHVILDDGWQSTGPDLQSLGGKETNTVGEETEILVQDDGLAESTRPPPSGASAAIYGFYRRWIEHAPSNSPMVMLWTVLCRCFNNKLRCTYANEGIDQAKRLRSVRANHLFEQDVPTTPSDRKGRSLRNLIATMKETHGVRSVFCWHHLLGYWCGLEQQSEEFKSLAVVHQPFCPTPGVGEVEPSQKWGFFAAMGMGLPSGTSGASKLYTAMHSYLKASGVDGVKVDGQSAIGQCGQGLGGGPAMARHFVTALENSVTQQFGSSECISCMSHSNENILNFKRSAVCRVSDDYLPDNAASQTSHIATCAFNSLFLGEVTIPDWDMFQSGNPSAQLHAAARSVCGGPVYVSDPPQEHNFDLLRQLVTLDGATLICDGCAKPTRDSMFCNVQEDGKSALKLLIRIVKGSWVSLRLSICRVPCGTVPAETSLSASQKDIQYMQLSDRVTLRCLHQDTAITKIMWCTNIQNLKIYSCCRVLTMRSPWNCHQEVSKSFLSVLLLMCQRVRRFRSLLWDYEI